MGGGRSWEWGRWGAGKVGAEEVGRWGRRGVVGRWGSREVWGGGLLGVVIRGLGELGS